MIRWFLGYLAEYQTAFIAVVGVLSPLFYGHWLQAEQKWPWLFLFVGAMLILVVTALAPRRYAKQQLLETILPTIHNVLGLKKDERVTVHHLKSRRREKYEQLVNYYPTKYGGRGRLFSFSHGISGERFKKLGAACYTISTGTTFEKAMRDRWNFGPDELSRLPKDRKSFFAIAIGNAGNRAKAVLYMDSPDDNKFSEATFKDIEAKARDLFVPLLEEILRD